MAALAGFFTRVEPRREARKYITGLISDLPRKNCWMLAEHAGMPRRTRCSGCWSARPGTRSR